MASIERRIERLEGREELRRVLEILSADEEEPKMGQYTKEMHEAYREEQDEEAAKEAQERDHRRQRMERANARRA